MAYKRISPMPIVEGGTNATTMANTDGVVYFDGTSLVTTAVGTATNVLTSNGAGLAPTFQPAGSGAPAASCSFFAHASVNQSIGSGAQTQVTFGSIDINLGSVFASDTFTVPTSGKLYYVSAQVASLFSAVGDYMGIYVNGSLALYASNSQVAPNTLYVTTTVSGILALSAGDVVIVQYGAATGTGATINGQSAFVTFFTGYQLT